MDGWIDREIDTTAMARRKGVVVYERTSSPDNMRA